MKKKNTIMYILYTTYFVITLLVFMLELFFKFGNPLFIIGQAFFIFGITSIRFYTFGYFIAIAGLCIVLGSLNIVKPDMFWIRYVLVLFFPFIPISILFSEWNDKRRVTRKGSLEVEAICKGFDIYGRPKFTYRIHEKMYIATLYKTGQYNYSKNDKVIAFVSHDNPKKIYIPQSEKQIKTIKSISIILTIIAFLLILLMLSE